jgi:hypothetical protein
MFAENYNRGVLGWVKRLFGWVRPFWYWLGFLTSLALVFLAASVAFADGRAANLVAEVGGVLLSVLIAIGLVEQLMQRARRKRLAPWRWRLHQATLEELDAIVEPLQAAVRAARGPSASVELYLRADPQPSNPDQTDRWWAGRTDKENDWSLGRMRTAIEEAEQYERAGTPFPAEPGAAEQLKLLSTESGTLRTLQEQLMSIGDERDVELAQLLWRLASDGARLGATREAARHGNNQGAWAQTRQVLQLAERAYVATLEGQADPPSSAPGLHSDGRNP